MLSNPKDFVVRHVLGPCPNSLSLQSSRDWRNVTAEGPQSSHVAKIDSSRHRVKGERSRTYGPTK